MTAQSLELTTQQFREAVLSTRSHVAVFDCDGTLWSEDAGDAFMRWSVRTGLLNAEKSETILGRHASYHRGEVSQVDICGEMTQIYSGAPVRDLEIAAESFFAECIAETIFPEMQLLARELAACGCELWAVSSTNRWVVEAGVRRFGIPPERVLAAHPSVAEGIATDQLLDVPTGPGKVAALIRAGVRQPDCVFGNSIHDADMLAAAKRPFAVNPTAALREVAGRSGWPVYRPQNSQGGMDLQRVLKKSSD